MAYNTIQDDEYINSKKKAIAENINVLSNGLSRFEKVLYRLTETGITNGKTNKALYAYREQVVIIHNKISGAAGIDYKDTVEMQAEHFVDKVKTAGGFLYD